MHAKPIAPAPVTPAFASPARGSVNGYKAQFPSTPAVRMPIDPEQWKLGV